MMAINKLYGCYSAAERQVIIMIAKNLRACVLYAMDQVESSHIAVLEDTTGKGEDSAEYREMQLATMKEMLAKIDAMDNCHE
jgi:hypothetical protein